MRHLLFFLLSIFLLQKGYPQCFTLKITPENPKVCAGESNVLSAIPIGGSAPFSYVWNTGETSQSIVVNNTGSFTVTVKDNSGICTVIETVNVNAGSIGTQPLAWNNGPVCVGKDLFLTAANFDSATYKWTGPNGFVSNIQNPIIGNVSFTSAGTYNVFVKINGCTNPPGTTTVIVKSTPAAPVAGNNSPLCTGGTLNLTASSISGATYNWKGGNGFISSTQNPAINNVSISDTGFYYVTATVDGCVSPSDSTKVVLYPVTPVPVASNSGPACTGATVNLFSTGVTGATYQWSGPNGFNSTLQNPVINNITAAGAGDYYVSAIVNGCLSLAATTTVVIQPTPASPIAGNNGPLCVGATLNLTASNIPGAYYNWTGPGGFSSTLQNPVINNTGIINAGIYYVTATVSGCTGLPGSTTVVIYPIPTAPVAGNNGPVCAGQSLNLFADKVNGASYFWSGPNGLISSDQNPVINNITLASAGIYNVNVTVNGCISTIPGTTTVIVNAAPQAPVVTTNSPLCIGATLNLFASTIVGASYSWSGPNGFSSTLQNPIINNVSLADSGGYNVIATVNNCPSAVATVAVAIAPQTSTPQVKTNSPICEGNTLSFTTPYTPGVTYTWTGPNGFVSSLPNPVIPNAGVLNSGTYSLTLNGCNASSISIAVVVNPSANTPIAGSNGPLCLGQPLNLNAATIPGATYTWSGPNGFTSFVQNPVINNVSLVNSGGYHVIATINNCPGKPGSTVVVVQDSARVVAGNDQIVCADINVVNIAGTVSGGSTTGIWSSSGSGTFSPTNTSLNTSYNLTLSDKVTGNVVLTLTSSNNGVCPASVSKINVTIPSVIAVNAGTDQSICESDSSIKLNGQVVAALSGRWTTSGNGSFFPDNLSLNPVYIPGNADKSMGSVLLTLTSTGNGNCAAVSDQLRLTINRGPSVNAGPDRVVKENETIVLDPVTTGSNLKYFWTPNLYLNNDTIKNPVVTGVSDQVYTLTATDGNGCKNSDNVSVTILRLPNIPNTFTPNNDGINDTWIIKNLVTFPSCIVQVFNRYGQIVFESKGYARPWDGTQKGKSLPVGTYYYVIEPGSGINPVTGYVTLIK